MNSTIKLFCFISVALYIAGCGSAPEATKEETPPAPEVLSKELLFERGHVLYLQQELDSANVFLSRAVSMDPVYKSAIADLAPLSYDLAMRADAAKKKNEFLRKSRDYYIKLETLGEKESDMYERLCEIANALNDDKTFLKYARKNADAYPYDRQFYNLSVAYFNVNDFNSVIKTTKEATVEFKGSTYIGSFYRQLGRAYMKIGRDQTAEKTFYAGLSAADGKIAELRKADPAYKNSADFARLKDDKIGMLISLKNLHTTYKATDKLAEVEKKLKELGK